MMPPPAPKSPARLSRVIVIVGLVVVAAIADVYYLETLPAPASATASTDTGDLQLNVVTNSSHLMPGHFIGITLSVENIGDQPLNVSAAGDWAVSGFPVATDSGCFGAEPIEFMVVMGNLSLNELRLESANSSEAPIFCMEGGTVSYFLFKPDSSSANLTGSFCVAQCHPNAFLPNLTSSFSIHGYWDYPLNSSEANDVLTPAQPGCTANGGPGHCLTYNYPEVGPTAQHPFVAGTYTMVVCDEWNQTAVLHFSVPSTGF